MTSDQWPVVESRTEQIVLTANCLGKLSTRFPGPWTLDPRPSQSCFSKAETISAASFILLAGLKASPDSASILRPSSTFVPSSLITTGNVIFNSRAASVTPCASVSHLRMPPKMLMNTTLDIRVGEQYAQALPDHLRRRTTPHVQEIRRLSPYSLIRSIVAMASPAPLTMQPTLPRSFM